MKRCIFCLIYRKELKGWDIRTSFHEKIVTSGKMKEVISSIKFRETKKNNQENLFIYRKWEQ